MATSDPLSELRIVLLGRSGEEKSKVGNAILRREVFSVKHQFERAQGLVNGRPVALINTPDLLDPLLPVKELFNQIERCVTLSAPGPHAFLLLQQKRRFTNMEIKGLETVLYCFSDAAFSKIVVQADKLYGNLPTSHKNVVDMCSGNYHIFNGSSLDDKEAAELISKIDHVVGNDEKCFLSRMIFQETELAKRKEEKEWEQREDQILETEKSSQKTKSFEQKETLFPEIEESLEEKELKKEHKQKESQFPEIEESLEEKELKKEHEQKESQFPEIEESLEEKELKKEHMQKETQFPEIEESLEEKELKKEHKQKESQFPEIEESLEEKELKKEHMQKETQFPEIEESPKKKEHPK
ncbi:hypothetical protein COCON_G00209490 [Conger conger]|uniref:AIG1-type G domain-containing protein n=1 Tax=Conger conger TaxID=82655 RepID=A0A9Q1D108_CONCO|nr:hypothetical protein COCON_G00209490 [Conger conger]